MPRRTVYLSLGSNLGDRAAYLSQAVALLHGTELQVRRISRVYETEPVYRTDQPEFYNVVLEGETELEAGELLELTAGIEQKLGRVREEPNAPRTLDIDILFFGSSVVDLPQLRIPHPRIAERRFVLEPLAEIAPDLRHPERGQTVSELLLLAPAAGVRSTEVRVAIPGQV